jgi:hypothetical protein
MNRNLFFITTLGAGILTVNSTVAQPKTDVIVQWNLITVKATKTAKQNSNLGSRTEAIEGIAVYDAVNAIKHFGTQRMMYW